MPLEFQLVGIGLHKVGDAEGWCVTYEKAPAEDEGGIPDFHHHMFPATIFKTYADQFGLDIDDDDDFDEVLDIVLHDPFAGDEHPADAIEPQGFVAARSKDKKNKTGRRMRRRADRGKQAVTITGLGVEGVRDRLRANRHKGVDTLEARLMRLEQARDRAARISRSDGSDIGAEGSAG